MSAANAYGSNQQNPGVIARLQQADNSLMISIRGAFSFPIYRQFREVCKELVVGQKFTIDLSQTTYMDSSALGMLLFLRERIGSSGNTISIANCRPEVRKILSIANFDKLFTIT